VLPAHGKTSNLVTKGAVQPSAKQLQRLSVSGACLLYTGGCWHGLPIDRQLERQAAGSRQQAAGVARAAAHGSTRCTPGVRESDLKAIFHRFK
jgi:hypothetical protein